MEKTIHTGCLLLALMIAGACSEDENISEDDAPQTNEEKTYTSYYYYSYEAEQQLSAVDFDLKEGEFTPGATCAKGDTLFVANIQQGHYSLELYDKKNRRHLMSLRSWSYGDSRQEFQSPIEAVSISPANRLYVLSRETRIDVFSLQDLKFVTRIGTGAWSDGVSGLFQAQAMTVSADGKIIARTKREIVVYREEDVTSEKYQNIPFYSRSDPAGMDTNNGFYPHQMIQDSTGIVYLADYGQYGNKKIQAIDTSRIEKGDHLAFIDTEKTIGTSFNPCGIALHDDRMVITDGNGYIHVYDRTKKEWGDEFKSVNGYTFKKAEKLLAVESDLWISDTKNQKLVKVRIYKNEIREY